MNTIDTILLGAAMASYGIYRVIDLISVRKAARLKLPAASDPYRSSTPPEFQPTAIQRESGPFKRCPACDAEPFRCDQCGKVRSDVTRGPGHWHAANVFARWTTDGGQVFLAFAHGTSNTHVCSPWHRVRVGLFKHCEESGIHVHQRCQRCNWEGIAMIGAPPKES